MNHTHITLMHVEVTSLVISTFLPATVALLVLLYSFESAKHVPEDTL